LSPSWIVRLNAVWAEECAAWWKRSLKEVEYLSLRAWRAGTQERHG
jgi:hypothetical protein